MLALHQFDLVEFLALHRKRQLPFCELLLGRFNSIELLLAQRGVLHLLLLLLDLLLDSVKLALLEAHLLHVGKLAELACPRHIRQLLFLGLNVGLELGQFAVLLLIRSHLSLSLLNFALNALFGGIHLVDLLFLSLPDFLRPLWVPPVQLLQEVFLRLLELLLGASEALVDGLDD